MLGLCFYQIFYAVAVTNVTLVFAAYILYCLLRKRAYKIPKVVALHFISLLIIGIGYWCSEWYIDNNFIHYDCSDREDSAGLAMIISTLAILIVCVLFRKRLYVINRFVDKVFVIFDASLLFYVMVLVIPNFGKFIEEILLFVSIPFLALFSLFGIRL